MARNPTAAERDQLEAEGKLCGATRRSGKSKRRHFAGFRTTHPGFGKCWMHGGATPNHDKAAIKAELQGRMVQATFGNPEQNEHVSARQALEQELAASIAHVGWLRAEVKAMAKDEISSTPAGRVLLSLYAEERDRKALRRVGRR